MSESSLSVGYPDLCAIVGKFLGYGFSSSGWGLLATVGSKYYEINSVVQSGIRRVYNPPATIAGQVGYEWSFLRVHDDLEVVSGTTDYDLPDDFGRLVDTFHFPSEEYRTGLSIVSVHKILELRANDSSTGYPTHAATRWKPQVEGSGQRAEVLLYPEPDNDWDMPYEYEAFLGAISAANPYPLGGMEMSELYIESCLAVAETRLNDEIGIHNQNYQTLLVAAIEKDKKRGPQTYGQMGQKQDSDIVFQRGLYGTVTYNGVEI